MLRTFKPVDLLSIAFVAIIAAITFLATPRLPHAGWLIARFAALLVALVIFSRAAARHASPPWVRALHAFLPVVFVPVMYDSMGDIIPWIRPRYFDELFIGIDYRLFLGHHPTVLLERFIHPLLTTVLQFAYISYYPMAIVLGVVLAAKKKSADFDEAIFGIILCFYLSYLGYLMLPAVGPRFTLAGLQSRDLMAGPLVSTVQNTLNGLENTKTDAFPSGHTAVALMTFYYAWRSRERVLAMLLLPAVTGLIVSTVYLRYHYVIDVIAGMALAVLTASLAGPLFAWSSRVTGQPRDQFHHAS